MGVVNFLRLDPALGFRRGSAAEGTVWNEFASDRARLHRVAAAIRRQAEASSAGLVVTADWDDEAEAPEGRVLLAAHQRRERDSQLVRRKKQQVVRKTGHLDCEVCGFNFAEWYGDLGGGFIECHHVVPLSRLRPGAVTRLKDLALVCANCHRMLHRVGEVMIIDGLRRIVHRMGYR